MKVKVTEPTWRAPGRQQTGNENGKKSKSDIIASEYLTLMCDNELPGALNDKELALLAR